MSDPAAIIIAIVGALGLAANALIAAFAARQSQQTHTLINSRMTELLRVATQAARSEGRAEGEQAQRDRAHTAEPT